MHATSTPDFTPSKLPSFCVTGPVTDLAGVTAHTVTLHEIAICNCGSPESRDRTLLRRFGRFVSHVVESDHVTFSAYTPEVGGALVQVVFPIRAVPELHIFACEGHGKTEQVDFSIYITARNTRGAFSEDWKVGPKTPFAFSVEHTNEQDKVDTFSLSLRSDYAGNIATEHLAALVAAYLKSDSTDPTGGVAGLEPSRVNFTPFLLRESRRVTQVINATNGHAAPRLLHTAFEDNVQQHPDNIAIEYLCRDNSPTSARRSTTSAAYRRRDVTYAELNAQANELASELGLLLQVLHDRWRPDLGDQYAVPLFIPPSPEFFLAMLAVLKSGHAFSSLPSDAPAERLRAIVGTLGHQLCLGSVRCLGREVLKDQSKV